MRTLLAGLAVALLATTAYGAAHLTMSVDGENPYTPAPGETFRVDVDIQADHDMSAWGMEPRDEADAGYTLSASVDWWEQGYILNYADGDAGPPFNFPKNNQGWDVRNSVSKEWITALVNDLVQPTGNPDDPIGPWRPGTDAMDPNDATSGWAMWFELTAPSTEAGVVTRIVLDDFYADYPDWTKDLDLTYEPLVLPEPVSALLLLVGLPLLRRRR